MKDDLKVGDVVVSGHSSSYGWRSNRVQETIVRATHGGKRLVTDTGTVIIPGNGNAPMGAGSYSSTSYVRYTEELQAQWNADDARRDAERRLDPLIRDGMRTQPLRYLSPAAWNDIARVIADHITIYTREQEIERARLEAERIEREQRWAAFTSTQEA